MSDIHPVMTRMAFVTTGNTGGTLDVNGPEGQIQMRRTDPYGVVISFGPGVQLSVHRALLPIVARYFLAAAILQDVDINEGWDSDQMGGAV